MNSIINPTRNIAVATKVLARPANALLSHFGFSGAHCGKKLKKAKRNEMHIKNIANAVIISPIKGWKTSC